MVTLRFGIRCYMEFSQENSKCVVDFMIPLSLSLSLSLSFSLSLSLSPPPLPPSIPSPPLSPSLYFYTHRYSPNGTAICVYYAGIEDLNNVGKFLDKTSNTKGLFEDFNQNTFSNENSDVQTSYLRVSLYN